MHQAMTELAGRFALRLARGQRAASRFERMAHDLAERAITCLLVFREDEPAAVELVGHRLAAVEWRVAGDLAALTQVGQKLTPPEVPGPFLELETQAIDLFVEDPLRIDVGAHEPAPLRAVVKPRRAVRIGDA